MDAMKRYRAAALALVAFLALPTLALAQGQDAATVQRGARVRVTTFDGAPTIGEFERWDGSSLLIYDRDEPLTFAFDDIDVLEVSQGWSVNTGGVVVGGLLGTAAGGALGCVANNDDYGAFCAGQNDTKVFMGAALGGAAGVALAALLFRVERWLPIPLLGLGGLR
jgi:hypothetical protein